MASTDTFYQDLPAFADFRAATRSDPYQPLPEDWVVVITDVRGSTQAIAAGRYKEVNALGVASIVAVLNAVKPLAVPYVFGGDGATLCVPSSQRAAVADALVATRAMAREAFALDLRVGMVDVARITADGYRLRIGKHRVSAHYHQAMFFGDGLGHAEALVKDPDPTNPALLPERTVIPSADFTGFECRWNEIASPHEETMSLLVQAMGDDATRSATYAEALSAISRNYGDDETSHPVRSDRLRLTSRRAKLATEVKVRAGRTSRGRRWLHAATLPLITAIGRLVMRWGITLGKVDWGQYRKDVVANTDHRKFDEVLRMVISGTARQREALRAELEILRQAGRLVYGTHAAPTALITCVIFDYDREHVHFLDASNGGYALAARELKAQLKSG